MLELAKKYLRSEVVDLLKNSKGDIKAPSLLSGNTKLDKGKDIVQGLAMLPADSLNNYTLEGREIDTVCPTAKNHGCDKVCIGLYSGHYSMLRGSAHKAQIKRSLMFHYDFKGFKNQLFGELASLAGLAMVNKSMAFVRLDVFSDNKKVNNGLIVEALEKLGPLGEYLEFYDYTKIHKMPLCVRQNYGKNIALSVSKNSLKGKLFTQYLDALPKFNYSAIVVPENEVQTTIDTLNKVGDNVRAVNGDLFDNFTKHRTENDSHIVLVLKGKASRNTKKLEVVDTFAINEEEAHTLYSAAFSELIIKAA